MRVSGLTFVCFRIEGGVITQSFSPTAVSEKEKHNSTKSLNIPEGQSKAVRLKTTNNIMVKRTRKQGQTKIFKTLNRKQKVEKGEPRQISGVNSGALEV